MTKYVPLNVIFFPIYKCISWYINIIKWQVKFNPVA